MSNDPRYLKQTLLYKWSIDELCYLYSHACNQVIKEFIDIDTIKLTTTTGFDRVQIYAEAFITIILQQYKEKGPKHYLPMLVKEAIAIREHWHTQRGLYIAFPPGSFELTHLLAWRIKRRDWLRDNPNLPFDPGHISVNPESRSFKVLAELQELLLKESKEGKLKCW